MTSQMTVIQSATNVLRGRKVYFDFCITVAQSLYISLSLGDVTLLSTYEFLNPIAVSQSARNEQPNYDKLNAVHVYYILISTFQLTNIYIIAVTPTLIFANLFV